MQNLKRFTQLRTFIANISEMSQDSQNQKDNVIENDSSRVRRKKSGELCSTIQNVGHVSLGPPKWTFLGDYISALGEWPLKFLHALEIRQGLLEHPKNWVVVRNNFKGEHYKLGLKFSVFACIISGLVPVPVGLTLRNFTMQATCREAVVGVINWVQLLEGLPPTKFEIAKTSKIRRNF